MAIVRRISTVNLKPTSATALNRKPLSTSSANFAGYIDNDDNNRYGNFKFGARTYGTTTEYSVGQQMPSLDTVEV